MASKDPTMTPVETRSGDDEALFFARLLATCPDSIYVYDMPRRRAVFRTQRLYEALGYAASEVEAPDAVIPQQFLHPEDRLDIEALFDRIGELDDGAWLDVNLRLQAKVGGWRHYRSRVTPLKWDEGVLTAFIGVLADTTVSATAAEGLRQSLDDVQEANRSKTKFLADLSHEIRTPLHTLTGAFDLLGGTRLTAEQAQLIHTAERAGLHLTALVDDAIDMAAIEAGHIDLQVAPVDLTTLVDDLVRDFASQARDKGIELKRMMSPDVPEAVMGDARRIRQVVGNFVSNALKFTAKGSIRLQIAAEPVPGLMRLVRISVADTGCGVPAELATRLFQRFSRGGHAGGAIPGTGLGLAIAADLATAMGGEVGMTSRSGEGATFWLELIMRPATTANGRPSLGTRHGARRLPAATVLVVDDNPDNLRIAVKMLEHFGLVVHTAEDGEAALAAARLWEPDLVLMDCQMPGMDGIETVRRLRTGGFVAPVLGLTANVTLEKRAACAAAGFDDVLTKPIRLNQLESQLGGYLTSAKEAS